MLEIKNIATVPDYQGKGYAKSLIDFIVEKYREQYAILQVGTGDSPLTIPFYEKCGFVRSHIICLVPLVAYIVERALYCGNDILSRDKFELKHGRAAENISPSLTIWPPPMIVLIAIWVCASLSALLARGASKPRARLARLE